MSDVDVRALERAWLSTRSQEDGERYVHAVLNATGSPILPIISLLIQNTRALRMIQRSSVAFDRTPLVERLSTPVTPEDLVAFLRGEGEWARGLPPDVRPRPVGSPLFCEHANEVPGQCPCVENCYCRQDGNTCSDVRAVYGDSDRSCGRCAQDALFYFVGGHGYVCAIHLAMFREDQRRVREAHQQVLNIAGRTPQDTEALDNDRVLLRDMIRHHENVDGDVRHCAYEPCGRVLPFDHTAVYCTNECAHDDA